MIETDLEGQQAAQQGEGDEVPAAAVEDVCWQQKRDGDGEVGQRREDSGEGITIGRSGPCEYRHVGENKRAP